MHDIMNETVLYLFAIGSLSESDAWSDQIGKEIFHFIVYPPKIRTRGQDMHLMNRNSSLIICDRFRSASPMHKPIKSVKKFSILLFTPLNLAKFRGKSNEGARYVWYNESKQFSNYLRPVRSASPMHKPIKSVKKFSILLFTPLNLAKLRGKSNEGARYAWYNESKQFSNSICDRFAQRVRCINRSNR